ncbi:hypothetical protein L1987_06332 [Smallanthus sonchifolius]|uniref:Uncharacterized protein n=1 Tax=Smallanthus sonchifolius TaxID=185202 RepID=A0ACB9JY05_9ASTR|nr:hypothetical protein L1987_06332 [Smallanthus sonchifolius]
MEYAAIDDNRAAESVKGKKVVVVGFRKTGLDIARECSSINAFKLPSVTEMQKDIARWDDYMKQAAGEFHYPSSIGALEICYNDQLCQYMGMNPIRKNGLLLPSVTEMQKDIARWDDYMKQAAGEFHYPSSIGALEICYNDQLCQYMGMNPIRKNGLLVLANLFEPYDPMDYTRN